MSEYEKKDYTDDYSSKSKRELILELMRLILLLIWKIIRKGIKLILIFILVIIAGIRLGWKNTVEWWKDNDTQEKVAEIKATLKRWAKTFARWCVIAAKTTAHWLRVAAIAIWHGIITGVRATIQGIIHMKPTVIKIWQMTVRGCKATGRWLVRFGRGTKLWCIRRKRAYQRFRKNKGFKGLLIDMTNAVKNGITMFVEEDQQEATPDAVTEDDLIEEEVDERIEEGHKAHKIGKKVFSSIKNIVDAD